MMVMSSIESIGSTSSAREAIEEIRQALRRISSEVVLEKTLIRCISLAEVWLTQHPGDVTEEESEVLAFAVEVLSLVSRFSEVLEEAELVRCYDEAKLIYQELVEILRYIPEIPVRRRIECEMRKLESRRGEFNNRSIELEYSRRQSKARELEALASPCNYGHRMVVREGPSGPFWGCENFPDCWYTRRINQWEREFLDS